MCSAPRVANIKLRSRTEFVDRIYINWWLLYLLLATCIPFSTALIGRFAHLAPSMWIYCFNTAAFAASAYRLVTPARTRRRCARARERYRCCSSWQRPPCAPG
jgi:hypothetical protein